jgi:hypothetical protein
MSIIINEIYDNEIDNGLTQDVNERTISKVDENRDQEINTSENSVAFDENSVDGRNELDSNDNLPQQSEEITPIVKSPSRSVNEYRVVGQLVLKSMGDAIDINIPIQVPGTSTPTPTLDFKIENYGIGGNSSHIPKLTANFKVVYSDSGRVYDTYQFGYDVKFNGYGTDYNHNLVSKNADFNQMIIPNGTVVSRSKVIEGTVGFVPTDYEVRTHTSNPTYIFSTITLDKPFLSLIFHDFGTGSEYHGYKPVSGKCKVYISNTNDAIDVNNITVGVIVPIYGSPTTFSIKNKLEVTKNSNNTDYGVCSSCPSDIDSMFDGFSLPSSVSLYISNVTVSVRNSNIQAYAIYVNHLE